MAAACTHAPRGAAPAPPRASAASFAFSLPSALHLGSWRSTSFGGKRMQLEKPWGGIYEHLLVSGPHGVTRWPSGRLAPFDTGEFKISLSRV